ncbi:Sugar lactone lactonase YvrE [Kaistia soli DSM 19436]|uniref:Sugar lactone lactonase YvrE n=1 Tax=Kaistia soli DSM 19436 TaxID=1122133 RepID=A0A1M5NGS6_9HYPH|nr:SMP-30/gluconolactonase/LRE family protein [Kaistia soli]SHG88635.1 Sugar lactone lactonase YvrE [Kaistia soli DSM 19436]
MHDLGLSPLIPTLHRLAECPVYDDRTDRILFCNIPEGEIHGVDLKAGEEHIWRFPELVASYGLCESGRFVVALKHSVVLFDPATGQSQPLASVGADTPSVRLNDGKVGPDGAFWVGGINEAADRAAIAVLYRVDAQGAVEAKVDGIKASNGLAFTADGRTMFHTDTRGPWIDRWRFDPATGAISERTRIAEPDDSIGRPDGGAADMDGYFWSAGISAGKLNRYQPDGKLVESFDVPAAPTMPCFGGADGQSLFVTSLRDGRSEEQLARYPLSGTVFKGRAFVAGVPAFRFRDV